MYPILLLMCACGAISACSIHEDAFFIAGAELVDAAYLSRLDRRSRDDAARDRTQYGVFAHRIHAGRGTVIAYRRYDAGERMTVDDETFEKMTLWLKSSVPGDATFDLSREDGVVAIYSTGGSAWPQSGCSGYLTVGTVTIAAEGSQLRVSVDARLQPSGNSRIHDYCHPAHVRVNFIAGAIDMAQLTPWLGAAAEDVYDETYR